MHGHEAACYGSRAALEYLMALASTVFPIEKSEKVAGLTHKTDITNHPLRESQRHPQYSSSILPGKTDSICYAYTISTCPFGDAVRLTGICVADLGQLVLRCRH